MNTRLLYTLFVSAFLLISATTTRDVDKFSNNEEDFLQELKDYLSSDKGNAVSEVYQKFAKTFTDGTFDQNETRRIIAISNQMLGHKMRAKPFFSVYLETLTLIKKGELGHQHFNSWHEVLEQMLQQIKGKKFKAYERFLKFSQHFLSTEQLAASRAKVIWHAPAQQYAFQFINNEPALEISHFDLVGTRHKARLVIEKTSGRYFPLRNSWEGQGGTVRWGKRTEVDLHATLADYQIDLRKGVYQCAQAQLYYPAYFGETPIAGTLEDKLADSDKYPRFVSSHNDLQSQAFGSDIQYRGGIRLEGFQLFAKGSAASPAELTFYDAQREVGLRCRSTSFTFREGEGIAANGVQVAIYIGSDSIFHPSANLRYAYEDRKLSLHRGKRGRDRNPFFSSYHNMHIDVDRINWDMATNTIDLGRKFPKFIDANKRVNFKSLHYYSEKEYRRYQNAANYNPISLLKIVAEKEGSRILDAQLVAKRINPRFDASNIQGLLYDLMEDGFIIYDKEKQEVKILEKIFHYADASQEKRDFDNIKLTSISDETNGVLERQSKDLLINGIKSFEFSHEHKVAAIPTGEQVLVKADRNLEFDGQLFAGFGIFEGSGYHFNYDRFQIEMDSVRFMNLYIPTGEVDKNGEPVAYAMNSKLEYLSGVLIMDAPENKSAKDKIDMFPIFNSQGPSYVYYDDKKIQNGCYTRDSFYFSLDPFYLNDMDKQIQKDISFMGTMVSANIFPDFKEEIVLQTDQSLGFTTQTPPEGFPAYTEKGRFTGDIHLSNKGFLGKGNITYKWVSIDSDDITLRPHQMLTSAQELNIQEVRSDAVQVPQVKGEAVDIEWKPYKDSMYLQAEAAPFQLFQQSGYTLANTLILTPDGLKGRGLFNSDKGIMNAHLFSFGAFSVESDTADLQIKASGVDHLALDTRNVFARLDFDAQMGYVKANRPDIITTLPYNKYQTSMNEYDWDMANEAITFKAKANTLGQFLSIHPEQDSLTFAGETARYDLKSNELQLGGVPNIKVADALVIPHEGKVEILPGGVITTLENATIIANTQHQYHRIERAVVDIKSKHHYEGRGFYPYPVGEKQQDITIDQIGIQTQSKRKRDKQAPFTTARGSISAEQGFYLDHKTRFSGEVQLQADQPNLQFEGWAQLDTKSLPATHWFELSTAVDQDRVLLPFDTPKNQQGQNLYTGLYIHRERGELYPSIMAPLQTPKDRAIFETKGLIEYQPKQECFYLGDSLKVSSGVDRGNILRLSDEDGKVEMEGHFLLGPANEMVYTRAAGKLATNVAATTAPEITTMAGINFHLPEVLLKAITNDLSASAFDAAAMGYKPTAFYQYALSEMIDDSRLRSTQIAEMLSKGYIDIPKKQNPYTLWFGQLPLKWISDYQSLVTTQRYLDVISVNGVMLNRRLEAYVEFKMPSNGDDRLYIYVKCPNGTYYFFGYRQGILNTVSNNEKYNDLVENLKKRDQIVKLKGDETYEIQLVNPGSAAQFIQRVQAQQQ